MNESAEKGERQNRISPRIEEGADYYTRLGVSPQASPAEIRAAFRALSKSLHPDAAGGGDSEKMKLVTEAYSILKDPEKRAQYAPPRSSGPNSNDIFRSATGRTGAAAGNENPDDLARSMGYKDFQDYVQQREAKKAERKINPEIVLNEAVAKVRGGGYFFKNFIDSARREGIPDVDNFIRNEKVVKAILDESVSKARVGAHFYGSYIEGWVTNVGFDRKQADLNPALLSLIHADLESKAKISAYFFTSHLDNWAQNNPNLTREEFTNTPELISALREQASKKRISEYSYNRFLDDWRNAGVDVTKLN
jgi:hypothetical protein